MDMVDKRISITNLICTLKGHDAPVVDDISYSLNEGESLAIIGESGSGKTMSALALLKLIPENILHVEGSFKLFGREILGLNEKQLQDVRGKEVGFVFQEPLSSLNPLHRVKKQIMEVIYIHNPKLAKNIVSERVVKLMREVGLRDDLINRDPFPHNLSGGQRQRVMIAIALANDPKLLIADEPTSALDQFTARDIIKLLKRITKDRGLATIFITHDLEIAKSFAQKVVVLKDGKIVEKGRQIFTNCKHEYTKLLLSSEPKPYPKIKPSEKVVLEVENLSLMVPSGKGIIFSKSRQIIKNISFKLKVRETVGIIGKSGSGKTMLALSLLALHKANGEVKIYDGSDLVTIARAKEFARRFKLSFKILIAVSIRG
jgi:microcin C transport system ATP-binding protein